MNLIRQFTRCYMTLTVTYSSQNNLITWSNKNPILHHWTRSYNLPNKVLPKRHNIFHFTSPQYSDKLKVIFHFRNISESYRYVESKPHLLIVDKIGTVGRRIPIINTWSCRHKFKSEYKYSYQNKAKKIEFKILLD